MKSLLPFLATVAICLFFAFDNSKLRKENTRLCSNIETLHDTITRYAIADSLNAATVAELLYSKKEMLKRYEKDQKLIKQLTKNAELHSLKKIEVIKYDTIITELHDTIITDSGIFKKHFKYTSKWTDISGFIKDDSIQVAVANRESLVITESLVKKKFWFFKLPVRIFGYKNKRIDVVSRNPNTQIQSVEFVNICE